MFKRPSPLVIPVSARFDTNARLSSVSFPLPQVAGRKASRGTSLPQSLPMGAGRVCLLGAILMTAALSLLFWTFPQIDLAASRWFYISGDGFYLKFDSWLQGLRQSGITLVFLYCLLASGLTVLGLWQYDRSREVLRLRQGVFLLSVMALGPGLVVNVILKDHWGRVRPRDILEFGGSLPFSRVWEIVPYCQQNCSFTSGEAGSVFALLALLFVIPSRWRLTLGVPLFSMIAAISFNRVLFGGHFLSDVVLSWTLVLTVILTLKPLILQRG